MNNRFPPQGTKTRYMARVLHTSTSNKIFDFQMIEIDVFRHNIVMSNIGLVFSRSRRNNNICLISGLRPLLKQIGTSTEQLFLPSLQFIEIWSSLFWTLEYAVCTGFREPEDGFIKVYRQRLPCNGLSRKIGRLVQRTGRCKWGLR